MKKITPALIDDKIKFIKDYISSANAADGSKFDANANVTTKNIATLEAEINKDINIQVNRKLVTDKITDLFGVSTANEYIRQIENHEIYVHDETSLKPYCASITMYPFLIDGLTGLGGESKPPKHLTSFCGSFINLVFAASSQFAGALATVEFLMYFDYFARKEYGDDYLNNHSKEIANAFQQVIYSINQPAAARGYQSVFWNISIYDKYYFDSMFGDFCFPDDYSKPSWNSVNKLQEFFLTWFNNERKKSLLTFPVITAAMLTGDGETKDKEFTEMCAEQLSNGSSFFIYQSDSADSLASCCRLRNEISDNTFSYTLGAGGVSTGSVKVITLNINRLEQNGSDLNVQVENLHKYLVAYREVVQEYYEAGMLTVYDAGFISLKKQFLTIGINGMVEAAEFNGISATNNQEYKDFVSAKLKIIYDANKRAKTEYGYMFNTEFVPAENLGVKNANWDKKDGYVVHRDCYNSYFYAVEDECNFLDKFILHGNEMIQYLDGGSALHVNLEEYASKEGFIKLLNISAKTGCNYFCFNIKITICNECENIDKKTLHVCSECGSDDIDYATRIIGYLKRVSSFSTPRQKEHVLRYYHKKSVHE